MTTKGKVFIGILVVACLATAPILGYINHKQWNDSQTIDAVQEALPSDKKTDTTEKAAASKAPSTPSSPISEEKETLAEQQAALPQEKEEKTDPVTTKKPEPIVTEDAQGNVTVIPQYPKGEKPEEPNSNSENSTSGNNKPQNTPNTPQPGDERVDPETGQKQFYDGVFGWVTPSIGNPEIAENAGTGEVIGH